MQFQLAHAQAKAAVLKVLDVQNLEKQLAKLNTDILDIFSCVVDKDSYLERLDLGRVLSD